MSVLDDVLARTSWDVRPFGRLTNRSKEAGQPDLEPLSVFLDAGVVPRAEREDNHNQLGADMSNYLVVRPGDIVFNKLRTWQGGLGVSRHKGVVSPAYFVCRPQEAIDPRYYHYLLRSNVYLAELTRLSKFMPPSQFDIAWDDLRTLPVLYPPLAEQRAIADYLDAETARIDALIAKKQQLIHLLEERFATFREEVLWADATPTPLHRLTDPLRPIVYGIVQAGPEVENGVPYIKTGDLALLNEPHRLSRTSHEIDEQYRRSRVHPGDIVVAMRASIGEAVLVPPALPAANLTQGTARIAPAPGVEPGWLLHAFRSRSAQEQCDLRAVGSTFRTLNIWDLRRIEVPVPRSGDFFGPRRCLDEAETAHDRATVRLGRQIELLAERRAALITAAVTGQFATPEAA